MIEMEQYVPVDKDGNPSPENLERCVELLRARGYARTKSLSLKPGEYNRLLDGSLVWVPKEEE